MREHYDPIEINDFFIWLGMERKDNEDGRFFLPSYETKNKIKVGKDYLISALVHVDYISLEFAYDKYFENGCVKSIKHDDGSIELFGGYNKMAEEFLHDKILIDKYNEFKRLRKLNTLGL